MDLLTEPFLFEFFRNGLYAAVMVGILCGVIGVFIVLRGMSYIGHGLAHASFGGAVLGYVFNVNFYVGAAVTGFVAALLINWITRSGKIKADAAIGIVTTAFFALGVALLSKYREFTQSFEAALFGNILGVSDSDLLVVACVMVVVCVAIGFMYKSLLFSTFDPDAAQVFGFKTDLIQMAFAFLLALAIIASMNVVGVTMLAAALVIPATIARMLTDHFGKVLIISTGVGASMGLVGMYASYHFDAASGASIVLFGSAIFVVVLMRNSIRDRLEFRRRHHHHGELAHSHAQPHNHVHASEGHEHDISHSSAHDHDHDRPRDHGHDHDHPHDHSHDHDHEHPHAHHADSDHSQPSGVSTARPAAAKEPHVTPKPS